MARSALRYDLYLPLKDNDGQPIPDTVFDAAEERLLARFGGLTDSDQKIYSRRLTVQFPDPLRVVNLRIEVAELVYPAPGTYLFALVSGGEEIAARRVRVYQIGGSTPIGHTANSYADHRECRSF